MREEIESRFGPEGVRKMADTRSFGLKFMWLWDPDFRAFVFESPAAELVGELLGCNEVRFYWDQIFTKEPSGRSAPTYWHTDQPGWPVSGDTVPSVWLPLAPVGKDDGSLSYVAGSHRDYDIGSWPHTFNAQRIRMPEDRRDFEDWETRRGDPSIRFLSWDMEPGDVVVLHPKVYHGAGANKASTRTRVALSTRWFGDDIRFEPKPECLNTPGMPLDRMTPGAEPVDNTLFPLVWRRPERAGDMAA